MVFISDYLTLTIVADIVSKFDIITIALHAKLAVFDLIYMTFLTFKQIYIHNPSVVQTQCCDFFEGLFVSS